MASCRLGIRRRLDNRFEGESDDSPRALELHNRRKNALHAILDGNSAIRVEHWGATDDSRPHEYVELLLSAATPAVFEYAIVPGVTWLGLKLAEKAFDTGVIEAIKSLVARLITKQETKQILDFMIQLPDGTRITVDPPDRSATIEIHFADGSLQSVATLGRVIRGASKSSHLKGFSAEGVIALCFLDSPILASIARKARRNVQCCRDCKSVFCRAVSERSQFSGKKRHIHTEGMYHTKRD